MQPKSSFVVAVVVDFFFVAIVPSSSSSSSCTTPFPFFSTPEDDDQKKTLESEIMNVLLPQCVVWVKYQVGIHRERFHLFVCGIGREKHSDL